ncbi:MAG: hypothetical protein ACJASY_004163 [Halioglobus sp.]
MRRTKHISLCAALVAMLGIISAETIAEGNSYYRWSDTEGNPVHSDRPPPAGTNYEVVSTGSSKVRQVSSAEGAVAPVSDTRKDDEFDGFEESKTEAPRKNPELCKGAKSNLDTLESKARVRIKDDDGEYRYLTMEEKETQKKTARDLIASYCE